MTIFMWLLYTSNTLGKGLKEKRLRTLEAKSKSCWNMHEAVSMPTVRNSHAMTWQETMAEKKHYAS